MVIKEVKALKCSYVCVGSPECQTQMYAEMFDKILNAIDKALIKSSDFSTISNLTGYKWKGSVLKQCYEFEVLRHMPSRITISVRELNKILAKKEE